MAGAKEIRSKISSVKNTQKITSAMQMVAASKMRRAQEKMASGRPYAFNLQRLIEHIAAGHTEYKHPYMQEREVKNTGYIIVSTERGLCGGLNINLFRRILQSINEDKKNGCGVQVALLGTKASAFFHRIAGVEVVAQHSGFGDNPAPEKLVGAIKVMTESFLQGKVDKICICCNAFKNTMVQEPRVQQLLPLPKTTDDRIAKRYWDYIYEPDPASILNVVLDRYVQQMVYQAVLENLASEQAARMVAMKAATDNAETLVSDLQLEYNKARQAGITNELIDIVSGAAAV